MPGSNNSLSPVISGDGRYVAFYSAATNLVPGDTNGVNDVFVHDRQTGVTERVSVDSSGVQGNSNSTLPEVSADGRYVAFVSNASNLVAGDSNGQSDVFVHDRVTGATERVDVSTAGAQSSGLVLAKAGLALRNAIADPSTCTDALVADLASTCATTVDGLVNATGTGGCLVTGGITAADTVIGAVY